MGRLSEDPMARLVRFVSPEPNTGCWLWTGSVGGTMGYGRMSVDNRMMSAHRVSWSLFRGGDPGDRLVCHKCDNPLCVNPDHLFLGDHRDNAADMVRKGRSPWSRKTHCPRGHEYTPANTKLSPSRRGGNPRRTCRVCHNAGANRAASRRRAESRGSNG